VRLIGLNREGTTYPSCTKSTAESFPNASLILMAAGNGVTGSASKLVYRIGNLAFWIRYLLDRVIGVLPGLFEPHPRSFVALDGSELPLPAKSSPERPVFANWTYGGEFVEAETIVRGGCP
jgi:hypothetical protein